MYDSSLSVALKDIRAAIARYPLAAMLGWQDIRQRYRRASLGPFWLTISMGVMIGAIGVVFGQIFKTPMQEYLPFLTIGIVLWGFISTVVTEGCSGFISAEGIIRQLPIPLFIHILRMIWSNILILSHNIIIIPLVYFVMGKSLSWTAVLSIPGFVLLLLNLAWVSLILATLCARYRDLPQIVSSILPVLFYLTPIMWMPSFLTDRFGANLLYVNPIYHLLEVVRSPLLGTLPTMDNWIFSAVFAVFGWVVALVIYGRYKSRIAYWL